MKITQTDKVLSFQKINWIACFAFEIPLICNFTGFEHFIISSCDGSHDIVENLI